MSNQKFSRRSLIKGGLIAGACIPALGLFADDASAAELTPLSPADPTAKALGFAEDTNTVNAKNSPTHTAAQKCSTCAQYTGAPGAASGGCNIFVGHSVPADGWCSAWAKKA